MSLIEKKILAGFFAQVQSGQKTFELRLADWECNPGDTLILKEIDEDTKEYTGREIQRKVGYIVKTKDIELFTPEEIETYGYQVISLLPEETA